MASLSKVTTYDATNEIREDLSNIIYDISPVDTPFMSNIGRDTCKNTYFEWQVDALAAASTSNAAIEGAAAGNADFTDTVRVANYTQISPRSSRSLALMMPWTTLVCARRWPIRPLRLPRS